MTMNTMYHPQSDTDRLYIPRMESGRGFMSITNCRKSRTESFSICRSSHRRCSMKKGVLRKFAKFTEKHLRQSVFFAGLRPATLLKKRLWHRCFPVNFAKFLRTPFSRNISGRLLLYIQIKRSKDYQDFLRVRRFCHNMKDLYLQL